MRRVSFLVGLALALAIVAQGGQAVAAESTAPGGNTAERVVREDIEWLDVWLPHSNEHALPRVLLIGDSITRAYYGSVEKALDGKAYVARLATSKSLGDPALLQDVALVLGQARFDVIHFNNGMHGWDYTEAEYRRDFPQLLSTLRQHAPGARLIWATTTPVRDRANLAQLDPRTDRVRARNAIAAEFIQHEGIPTDDLFALAVDHPEFSSPDGVHFSAQGVAAQAPQVAASIEAVLKQIQK